MTYFGDVTLMKPPKWRHIWFS